MVVLTRTVGGRSTMSLLKLFSRERAHIHSEVSLLFSHDGTVQEIKIFSALTKFDQSGTLDNEGGLR
jgi:hypothetical protein